jgi:hypothetical protein
MELIALVVMLVLAIALGLAGARGLLAFVLVLMTRLILSDHPAGVSTAPAHAPDIAVLPARAA